MYSDVRKNEDDDEDDAVVVVGSSSITPLEVGIDETVEGSSMVGGDWTKGEIQPPEYRDKWYGIAFWIHLIVVFAVGFLYMNGTLKADFHIDSINNEGGNGMSNNSAAEDGGVFNSGSGGGGGGRARFLSDLIVVPYRLLVEYSENNMFSTLNETENNIEEVEEEVIEKEEESEEDRWDDLYGYNDNNDLYNDDGGIKNGEGASDSINGIRDLVSFVSTFILALTMTPILAVCTFTLMFNHAIKLIQAALLFGIVVNFILGVILLLVSNPMSAIFPLVFAIILACYSKTVWNRIPFAAANLRAGITAVKSNLGLACLGLISIPMNFIWMLLWTFTFMSVVNSPIMTTTSENAVRYYDYDDGDYRTNTFTEEHMTPIGYVVWVGFLISLYWTLQVIRNVFHTTVAGTIGTWWFLPHEASSCCSRGMRDSWWRSMTYSFGSIALGSLIVAILETIRAILRGMARNRRAGIFRCVAQCVLLWLERIMEYFNKWAFIYVGLYGYSYIEAGKNVFALFRHRGWSTIISDTLVQRLLIMMCVTIALVVSIGAAILGFLERADEGVIVLEALLGFVLGLIISSNIFGVISSAVDTIIVLYAEAPRELEQNHPHLAMEMKQSWIDAWPDVFSGGLTSEPEAVPVVAPAEGRFRDVV